jgi:hypothetical protein
VIGIADAIHRPRIRIIGHYEGEIHEGGIRAVIGLLLGVDETITAFITHMTGIRVVVDLVIGVDETLMTLVLLGTSEVFRPTFLTVRRMSGIGAIANDMNDTDLVTGITLKGALQVDTNALTLQDRVIIPLARSLVGATVVLVLGLEMMLQSLITVEVLVIIRIRGTVLGRVLAVMMKLTVALLQRSLLPVMLALMVVALSQRG